MLAARFVLLQETVVTSETGIVFMALTHSGVKGRQTL